MRDSFVRPSALGRRALGGVLSLLVGLLILSSAVTARGQDIRAEDTGYIRIWTGLSGYGGDRSSTTGTKNPATREPGLVFGAVGGELGYQFTPAWSLGLALARGTYPKAAPSFPDQTSRLHTGILARWTVLPQQVVSPYLTGGAHLLTGGPFDQTGYGPVGAVGADIVLSDRLSFFLEGQANMSLPDEAADNIDASSGYDMLYSLGGGLKVTFGSAFTPVRITEFRMPDTLTTGEEGMFSASVNEEASRPVERRWQLGDGTTYAGSATRHTYSDPGTYTASFMADNGREVSQSGTVVVLAPPEIVTLRAKPTSPEAGQEVQLQANVRGSDPLAYHWDLDDGTTMTESQPEAHVFDEPGSYTATLQVRNPVGQDRATLTVEVQEAYDPCEEVTSLNTVHFEFDESSLNQKATGRLQENVQALTKCSDIGVRIDGYTDQVGPERYNIRLSERRARSVSDYYTEHGIPASRIQTRGRGEASPSCRNDDPGPGCRRNRRAESIPLR